MSPFPFSEPPFSLWLNFPALFGTAEVLHCLHFVKFQNAVSKVEFSTPMFYLGSSVTIRIREKCGEKWAIYGKHELRWEMRVERWVFLAFQTTH